MSAWWTTIDFCAVGENDTGESDGVNMSKPQMWIVAAAVGVVALIAGVKHFSGSTDEDETGRVQQLARQAKTEHGGWSVRSNSQDLPTSDDVKVQSRVEAKPGGIAPARPGLPGQPQGGQPAAGFGSEGNPAQPNKGIAEDNAPDTNDDREACRYHVRQRKREALSHAGD